MRKPIFFFAMIVGLIFGSESAFGIAEDWEVVPPSDYGALFQQLQLYGAGHSSPSAPPDYMELHDPYDYCSTPVQQRMMNAIRVIMNTGITAGDQVRDVILADRPTLHTDEYYVVDPSEYPNGLPLSLGTYWVKAFPYENPVTFADLFYFHDGCK